MLDRRFLDVSIVVAGIANSPAASPTAGTQYIVGSSPTGDFSGATANQLARYDGSKWIFSTPKTNGLEVLNVETKEVLSFDGTAWTTKISLAKAKNNDNFAVVDYFADKSYYGEPNVMTGYTPDEFLGVYSSNNFGFIYQAASEGILKKVEKTDIIGKTILIIKNDNAKLNTELSSYVSTIVDEVPDDENLVYFNRSQPDFVFCKQTQHFYKYDKTDNNYVDLGAVSESDFTQIDGGVFFYYAATNSFYYVDTENGTFAVIPLGGSSKTGSSAIAPVKGIVDTLPTTDITSGDRYALTSDFKVHEYNGTEWTAIDVPIGGMFLNKADSLVYVYDGENFEAVNTGGDSGGGEHEGHNFFIPEYSCVEYKSKSSVYDPGELVKDGDMIYRADSSGHIQNEVDYSEFRVGSIFFFDKVKSGDHGDAFPLYRFNGVDAENRFDFIDYVQDGDLLFNKVNKHFYVFETSNFYRFTDIGGIGESSSGGGDEIITETHTLTAEEATAKSFTLANSIKTGKEADVFLSVCGMVQIAGVDYTASENTISWSDKTLADIGLQAGDVFLVQYTKA